MSKKRAKSGGSAGASRWETGLLTTPFEEDEWKCTVAFVVGNKLADYDHICTLTNTVDSGSRKLFSVISKNQLIDEVKDLGSSKGKKTKETPLYSEICEVAKAHLDQGDEIPLQLLSKVLKWKLLAIKQKDQKRREDEKKGSVGNKDRKGGGKEKGSRSKSPAKGKGKKSPEVPSPKKDSKLKKRGENDDENKYIDDEPDDGSQHYVIIEGFTHIALLPLLSDLQINIDSIIKISSENYESYEKLKKLLEEEEDEDPKPPEILEIEEKERDKVSADIKKFWDQHEKMLRKGPKESKLHDVARLAYTVKEKIIPTDLSDNEQKMQFGAALFEDIACLMYDLLDLKRQYVNYRDNMKLLNIPCQTSPVAPSVPDIQSSVSLPPTSIQQMQGEPPTEQKEGVAEVDMRYYNEMMNCLPFESVSVPLVLHCMLEQVVASEEGKVPPSEIVLEPREDNLNHSLAKHVNQMALKLAISDDTRKQIEDELNIEEKVPDFGVKQPHLINFHDKIAYRLQHLKEINGFNPIEVERNMLNSSPCARLCKFPRPTAKIVKERAARLQELMYFCSSGELTAIEVDRAFKQFVFECLCLRDTDDDGKVREAEKEDIVWDDPYPVYEEPQHNSQVEGQIKADEPRSRPGTGILRSDQSLQSKSRIGSAGSIKSVKSTVHFEKDADGQPIIPEKDIKKPVSMATSSTYMQEGPEVVPSAGICIKDLSEQQLRNLDEWSYAEYLEPHVLLQVLEEANCTLPYIDTYFHKRDHSLMVVMHNPVGPELMNYDTWNTQLHSDVGFRNYLEHISESIKDWTQSEEVKYQALMREKEMEAMRKAAESPAATSSRAASSKSRTRSQSPKKSRSKSPRGRKSASPTQSVDHLDPDGGQFMRPNSMKAWKIENDKLKEEERKQKEKSAKKSRSRSRSASPKKGDEKEKVKDKKREGSSRGSAKGKKEERGPEETSAEIVGEEILEVVEQKLPFIGYDVGNSLLHVSGQTKTLFPSDGGQIRTETTKFIQGSSFVKTTVFKDGHVFAIHLLEPNSGTTEDFETSKVNDDNFDEKADNEQLEKTDAEKEILETTTEQKIAEPLCQFGAFTAHLNDGMMLSYSCYGNSGKPKGAENIEEAEIFIPPPPSPSPPPQSPSPKGRAGSAKKGKKQQQQLEQEKLAQQQLLEQQQREEEERKLKEMEEKANSPEQKIPEFQQLHISCPDGLSVNYSLESDPTTEMSMRLMVRQSYHAKTAQKQECEAVRKIPAMMEESRIICSDGAVIKFMLDGTTQVLFPDGTVSGGTGPGPVAPLKPPVSPTVGEMSPSRLGSAISSEVQTKKSSLKASVPKGSSLMPDEMPVEEPEKPYEWITTTPSGVRVGTKGDGNEFDIPPLMVYSATDPTTNEVMTTREDRVVTIDRPDGTRIVDHNEGTRITTFYTKIEVRDDNCPIQAETGEMQPVMIRDVRHVKIECTGFATVIMNCEDSIATTVFPNGTQVITMPDGSYEILHHEGSRMTIDPEGMCAYLPKPDNLNIVENLTTPSVYMMRHSDEKVLELRDGNGNFFTVMNTGDVDVFVRPKAPKEEIKENAEDEGQEKMDEVAEDKTEIFNEHPPRFFIIKNDGSGMELLRHRNVMDYLSTAECDPTSAILGDPLPDHPGVTGITIMRPYTENICNTWLMQFDEPNIIPRNLRSRDFKTLPTYEAKTDGPKFGTNVGKGVAVGSVNSKVKSMPPPRCPKAIELRQLIKYTTITNELRAQMQEGLRAYAEHVKENQDAWRSQEIYDPRDDSEKVQAGNLLAQILSEADDAGEVKDTTAENTADAPPPQSSTVVEKETGTSTATKPSSMVQLPANQGFGSGLRNMNSEGDIIGMYEKVTAPPVPPPQKKATARYSNEDWQRVRADLEDEKNCRNALKNKEVPPYFSCTWGQSFLASQCPDMDALSKNLAKPNKTLAQPTDSLPNTPTDSPGQTQGNIEVDNGATSAPSLKPDTTSQADSSPSPITQTITVAVSSPSDVRPTNPTPGHATGQGTPTPLRPTNPTPAHASQTQAPARPGNPTPAGNQDIISDTPSSHTSIPLYTSIIPEHNEENVDADITAPAVPQSTANVEQYEDTDEFPSAREKIVLTRSLIVDVNGEPRKERVALPSSILGQKPGALPNQRFQEIEDPVRTKTFNSSIASAKIKGVADLNKIRGFELYPGQVNFGVVREGCTYTFNVLLKNIGVDSCRFKIKQPPPSTGLSVIYKSGLVAAGMNVTLCLELYAIAVGVKGGSGQGSIGHHVEISSEVETLFLPVTADVLTGHVYDEQCRIHGPIAVHPGVTMVSTRPPSREGIIRPRKDRSQECSSVFDNQVIQ